MSILHFDDRYNGLTDLLQNEIHFFTFGADHLDRDGQSLDRAYVILIGTSMNVVARMQQARGPKYCTSYPIMMLQEQLDKGFLLQSHELVLEDVDLREPGQCVYQLRS